MRSSKFFWLLLVILTLAGCFYLFVLPALVADNHIPATPGAIAFAAFLYLQFWMLIAEFTYVSAAALYGFRRRTLFTFFERFHRKRFPHMKVRQPSLRATVILCTLSYFWTIYGFAIAYAFVSHSNALAFTGGQLNLFTASYFSLVTAATVGYGDIAPVSVLARSLVMLEITLSFMYAAFLFSVLASSFREATREKGSHLGKPNTPPDGDSSSSASNSSTSAEPPAVS